MAALNSDMADSATLSATSSSPELQSEGLHPVVHSAAFAAGVTEGVEDTAAEIFKDAIHFTSLYN